jgi:predicted dehydrogenase
LLTVGVIGCGYWGPNLIRNFSNLKEADVRICSDLDEGRLKHMKLLYPSMPASTFFVRNPSHSRWRKGQS